MAKTPIFLPGESPWTEEPGGLHSVESESETTERPNTISNSRSGWHAVLRKHL